MDFITLKNELEELSHCSKGNIAIFVSTSDGDIKINESTRMSSASVIKVPIAMACFHAWDNHLLDIEKKVKVTNKVGGAGVLCNLSGEQEMSIINLIELAIIVSDNTASNLLINELGMDKINQYIKQAGITNTELNRNFMDLVALQSGLDNYTTAEDMMKFLKILEGENDLLSKSSRNKLLEILGNQQFRHKLAFYHSDFQNDITLVNKTGELGGVEHDVGLFVKGERRVQAAVLTTGWQHNYEGQQFIGKIGRWIMAYLRSN